MADDFLITREEVLGGLPAARARTLLFLIESRTAHLVAKSRQAMQLVLTEQVERERDLAFLEAFALNREPPLRPSIQDIERHAPHWASLVPDNPRLRAAVAHLLGEKYRLAADRVPNLRAALRLQDPTVQRAHQQLYRQPLEAIFVPQITLRDRLRWIGSATGRWLESLPPFWTAFALTLTETVGAGILALPIALAAVGPIAAVALLVLLGVLNVLTVAALCEAASRSASVRYENAFFGRLVGEFLGGTAGVIASGAVTAVCVTALLAYYLGLAGTLGDVTFVPPAIWMLALFGVQLYFLTRASLRSTVASALVTGAVNIGLVVILGLLTLRHASAANLLYVNLPFLDGRPFDPTILRLIFGVVLLAYCGHLSVGNCAQLVLRQDPGGRALLWGCVAAQATAVVLYSGWVLAVNGALAPATLAGRSGTVLGPLAQQVGPAVNVLGVVYVVLAMGMASIHFSLGLFNLVRDRLPRAPFQVLVLPRGRVRLILGERLSLEYLGRVAGEARFRAVVPVSAGTRAFEFGVRKRWDAVAALSGEPDVRAREIAVSLDVLDAEDEHVRVRVESMLAISVEGDWTAAGPGVADILELADDERRVVTWLARHGEASAAQVATHLGCDEAGARATVDRLVEQGLVRRIDAAGAPRFRAQFASRRTRILSPAIWDAIVPTPEHAERRRPGWTRGGRAIVGRARAIVLAPRGRFALALSPTLALFLFAEWLMFTGADSFSEALNIGGVIGASLVAGILPVLLLTAIARKGEIAPGTRAALVGTGWMRSSIYAVFLAGLALHGLLLWEGRLERALALAVTLLVIGSTLAMVRWGAFSRRVTVELRQHDGQSIVNVVDGGHPRSAEVSLRYDGRESVATVLPGHAVISDGLAAVSVPLDTPARELKVWAHRVSAEGESEALPSTVTVYGNGRTERFDLGLSGGHVVIALDGAPSRVEIALTRSSTA